MEGEGRSQGEYIEMINCKKLESLLVPFYSALFGLVWYHGLSLHAPYWWASVRDLGPAPGIIF